MGEYGRKFLFVKGRFFILYRSGSRNGLTLLLGPEKFRYLFLFALICVISYFSITNAKEIHDNQYILTITVCVLCLLSFIATGMMDPGVIWDSSNWSDSENQQQAENLVFCSICGVYRPASASHCISCNVCYEERDHHCSFIGICIAKRNRIAFQLFELTAILLILFAYKNGVFSI